MVFQWQQLYRGAFFDLIESDYISVCAVDMSYMSHLRFLWITEIIYLLSYVGQLQLGWYIQVINGQTFEIHLKVERLLAKLRQIVFFSFNYQWILWSSGVVEYVSFVTEPVLVIRVPSE